jgi:hypothetical protein
MKPILFNTPMVQALLNTKPDVWPAEPIDASKLFKWQTRRVIKPQPTKFAKRNGVDVIIDDGINAGKRPYFVGDILYVRETWRCGAVGKGNYKEYAIIDYKAGERKIIAIPSEKSAYYAGKALWMPSIHLPREAARLFLEVKNIRVERLRDISEEDAEAEGVNEGYEGYSVNKGLCGGVKAFPTNTVINKALETHGILYTPSAAAAGTQTPMCLCMSLCGEEERNESQNTEGRSRVGRSACGTVIQPERTDSEGL